MAGLARSLGSEVVLLCSVVGEDEDTPTRRPLPHANLRRTSCFQNFAGRGRTRSLSISGLPSPIKPIEQDVAAVAGLAL